MSLLFVQLEIKNSQNEIHHTQWCLLLYCELQCCLNEGHWSGTPNYKSTVTLYWNCFSWISRPSTIRHIALQ